MKFFPLLIFLCAISAFAEPVISDKEAAQHVDEKVEVRGKVFDVHVSDSGLVLINFGAKYPAQTFTAVVFADHAAQFPEPEKYIGATLAVRGTIRMHQNKTEMVLDAPDQLTVLLKAEAAPTPDSTTSAASEPAGIIVGPDGVTRRILPFTRNAGAE